MRPGAWLVLKRWRIGLIGAVTLVTIVAAIFLVDPLLVPGRDHVLEVVWPLLVAIPVATSVDAAAVFREPIEILARRSLMLRKGAHMIVTAAVVGAVAAASPTGVDPAVVLRNGALLGGLGYLLVVFAPRGAIGIVLVLVPAAMWILGSRGPELGPAGWAVLLLPAGSTGAGWSALALGVLGSMVFLCSRSFGGPR